VLSSGSITERAQSVGLKRLQEALNTKWVPGEVLLQVATPPKSQFEQGVKRIRVEGLEERSFLGALFKPEREMVPRPLGGAD
jgi:hypothetical protein